MASLYNAKYFNSEVIMESVGNIKDTTKLEIVQVARRRIDSELPMRMPDQKGGNIASIIVHGNLGGSADNYDGETDISVGSTTNYLQTVVAIGRAKAWKEEDFQVSIAGYSELDAQIYQLAIFQDKEVKKTLLSTLKGIFASALSGKVQTASSVAPESLINLMVATAGDMADDFDTVVMDSYIAGELAKKELLEYAKYNDAQGIQRVSNKIGYWGGKLVIVDDAVGTNSGASASVHNIYAFTPYSFRYSELAVKVPFELHREPLEDGGVDVIIERQRFVLAPEFVSFKPSAMAKKSPTNAELENGSAWELVKDGNGTAVEEKVVPFACLTITLA